MSYYDIYQKIGGYPAVVVSYATDKDLDKCFELIRGLMDIFANESKRYFTDIIDINFFQKLFNAIALLMIREKQGFRNLILLAGLLSFLAVSLEKSTKQDIEMGNEVYSFEREKMEKHL